MKYCVAIVIAGVIALITPAMSFAAPAAGTVIGNQATATYNDAGGTARTTTSNLVQTTVSQVKSFVLSANGSRTAAPGQTVYYPHTISNTGNGADTYTLNPPTSSSFGAGPHTSLAYYIDANGDGVPDNSTPITTSGPIAAGGVFRFVVSGTVPAGATSGNTASITVSVSDTNPTTSTNQDTTTVANSVISVTKSLSVTSGGSPGGPVTVTLSYVNTGSAAASNVQITDNLPATLTYVANSGRWSVSGATPLTDANDGIEQAVTFPPGIDYRSSLGAGASVVAILSSVPAGASANVSFQVNVNANLAPQTINNTAQFLSSTQLSTNTNTASYQVLQGAIVVANGSNNNSANGVGEPVTITSAPSGSTLTFNDFVWNKGNGTDTFDITVPANTFPTGSTVTLLQQDGATSLINSGGSPAPDTGPIPGVGQACPTPFVTDTTITPSVCGYKVVVRVTLPPSATAGPYSLTLRATSVFNNTVFDDVLDTLGTVAANTVDVTNDRAAPPAGTAAAADGLGGTGTTVIRTNTVTPGAAATPSRFRVWVTNTGLVSYDFALTSTLAASTAVGVVPPALPAGWTVTFRDDASGAAADCTTVGAIVTSTGPLLPGAAKLECAEITVPPLASSTAYAGNYDFDFSATSTTNSTVTDVIRDRLTVNLVRNITFAPDLSAQTFANGSVTYTHTLVNAGNSLDTVNFAAGCMVDSRAAQGWVSTGYVDTNNNGTLETGTDAAIVCGTTNVVLSPGESRAIFVRSTAPATAAPADPANVTTLTGTYASTIAVHDSTTVISGLLVTKEQQALGIAGCTNNNAPAGSYSTAALPASPSTAAGACIAYRITTANTSGAAITAINLSDLVPANTRIHYACSGNGTSSPSVTAGTIAGTTPADGGVGTVTANIGALAAAQSAVTYFCVQVNAATVTGTPIPNQANVTGTQAGNSTTVPSNSTQATVGAVAGSIFTATLVPNHHSFANPGDAIDFAHVLTNTGTTVDNYSLSVTETPNGFGFTSITLLPDANGDGRPDSNVPVTNPITLNAGQSFHFVVHAVTPTNPHTSDDILQVSATSVGGAAITGVQDTGSFIAQQTDCASAAKFLSRERGSSPSTTLTVTINYFPCDKARAKLTITDVMPAGMHYVAGSGRWTGTASLPLTDAVAGDDRQGTAPKQIAYDFGSTFPNAVTATIYSLAPQENGSLTFQVTVDAGVAIGTTVTNQAAYVFSDANGFWGNQQFTSASYLVTGKADFTLTGQHLPTAQPGTTVTFTNVLTNKGDATDTFDISVTANTFPTGAVIHLLRSDGTTPLTDTDGDGTVDTGPLAPGASYNIIVKVDLPVTTPPGAYKLSKTAHSALAPSLTITVDDTVDAVAQSCHVTLDPDNQALVGFGEHVTYTHYLTNRGNCDEPIVASLGYLGDSLAGWTSAAYIDNPVAGGGSIPGVVDSSDTLVVQGWTRRLAPGERVRVLVDVRAPDAVTAAKAARAKALVASDVTTLVLNSTSSGALVVHDTTNLDDAATGQQPDNVIRNFTDGGYSTPTAWGVIGRNLFLRADAGSCNADPNVAESRTVIITGSNGDRETATATETGPNTGIFVVASMPIHSPPVAANDGIVEGDPNDVFTVDLQGCGRPISTVVTLMNGASVVFDSSTNATIAGATITLVGASGGQCLTTPSKVTTGTNPVVTGSDGRFTFNAAAGDYCLSITPPNGYKAPSKIPYAQLPAGRNLNVTGPTSGGSYGNPFHIGADGLVVVDIPLDLAAQTGLFVQKDASKPTAELGDFVDYTIGIRNGTGNALNRADVILTDSLPAGFAYVKGTARRDGVVLADPKGGGGPVLSFTIGHLDQGATTTLTYRVRLGPGAMQGDGTNRAQGFYTVAGVTTMSNVAMAKVLVTGGVFSSNAFILGKIFLDCNANGVQDAGEEGMPGIRVVLEDGTYAITDGGGKYSFYGISDHTHVLKIDRLTLPSGAKLEVISRRNLGDPNTRIVDLRAGELARGDFAIEGCEAPILAEARARRDATRQGDELASLAGTQLTTEPRVITDVKALPASGTIELAAPVGMPGAAATNAPPLANAGYTTLAPASKIGETLPTPAPQIEKFPETAPPQPPLEKVILDATDNTLAFMDFKDGQVVTYAQANVRVKGVAGTSFKLTVNGDAVGDNRVGKRSTLAEKQLQAWEFVGVELRAGENTLTVTQIDSFGNERGTASVKLMAPGKLGKLLIEVPKQGGIADGKTPVKVTIVLVDDHGVPVNVRTAVTLEATKGRWLTEDADPKQPGLQVFVENGRGEFMLAPPLEPGDSMVYAASGGLKAQMRLDFLPEMRNMIATGVIEGVINARNMNTRALVPTTQSDAFDAELRQLSREWNGGKTDAGVRAAFYLKGKIKGDYLLTAAYDSDKDTQERLFRDIQPDEFYPVYGDSSVRGFDAQSTSKLYVRVDKDRSYLLWGDFNTSASSETRKLTNYTRSLTGIKEHYENSRVSVNAFASRDTTRQVIEELRANGTSGPFQLSVPNPLVNSETVEVITRDRNQPAIIINSVPQARFTDYEMEPLTGRILFKGPIASVDQNLNPNYVRVTYEVDQGGPEFWVAGVDGQVKVTDRIEVGGIYVKDQNPLAPFTLGGANMVVKLGASTYVITEVARTTSALNGADELTGNAGRIELKHESKDLKADIYIAKTDANFNNPGSYLTQGRSESGGKIDYKLSEQMTLHAEALRTGDDVAHSVRTGGEVTLQYHFAEKLTLEIGVRHSSEKDANGVSPIPPTQGQPTPTPLPDEVTTVRARVTGQVPQVKGLSLYGEAEVDVNHPDDKVIAAGGEYELPNKSRIYARHEFISSITGPYGLNPTEQQNSTAIGVDTEYMKDGRFYSEYRIRDALDGGAAEAAFGLKNLWSIAPGLKLGTTFERVHTLSGTSTDENTAVALALEYTANPNWKGSTRLEVRDGSTQDSLLFTVGLAAKINRDMTALARNAYTLTRNDTGGGEQMIDRMQAGLAWRDNETNKWNALARIEYRIEHDDSQVGVDLKSSSTIISAHGDYQLSRPFLLSGRYAAKWTTDGSNGLTTKYHAQVVGARANWEFASKWDVSFVTSAVFGEVASSRQYGVGLEFGYLMATNLWLSAGYNIVGYTDADLAGADYTARGPFVRLRYKFDESVIEAVPGVKPLTSDVPAPAKPASEGGAQ